VGVICKGCGTEIILDMASEYKPEGKGFAPDRCPTCETSFDSAVKPALDRFKAVVRQRRLRRRGAKASNPHQRGEDRYR